MNEEFVNWVEENNYLYKNFCDMEICLKKYLTHRIENISEMKSCICNNFNTVIGRCDEISYDEDGVPEAYIILHFLDRYHRFQLMLLEMFRNGTFPIKENLRVMDIGTGPGPSLYAVSDMIALFQQYEIERFGKSSVKTVEMDYVEQSQGFRDFLHHMTEILMKYRQRLYVPFHHGTYYDADQLNFTGEVQRQSFIWSEGKYTYYDTYMDSVPKSFDLVIYSNFLTNIDVLNRYELQLKRAAFYLKNKGNLLIVGGNPKDRKYAPVYEKIDQLVLEQDYNNDAYEGACTKVGTITAMKYSDNDPYGRMIKDFYKDELNMLTDENWEDGLDDDFRKQICNYLDGDTETKWYYVLYKRCSKFRKNL